MNTVHEMSFKVTQSSAVSSFVR